MATINTLTYNDFVDLIDKEFNEGVMSIEPEARGSGMFKEVAWGNQEGTVKRFSEVESEEYADEIDEGDVPSELKTQIGYEKDMKLKRIGYNVKLTNVMMRHNKYRQVLESTFNRGKQLVNTMELDLQHRITFGTATSYTDRKGRSVDISVGSGKALFATDHTLTGSSTTYRNILASNPVLSETALEAMEKQAAENTLNNFGEKMTCNFDILWTTDNPATMNTARRLIQATAQISASNEGVPNVYRAKYRHVKLSRVATDASGNVDSTKATYWGLCASGLTTAYLAVTEEPHFSNPLNRADGSTLSEVEAAALLDEADNITFKARAEYGIAICSPKAFHFSDGSGS